MASSRTRAAALTQQQQQNSTLSAPARAGRRSRNNEVEQVPNIPRSPKKQKRGPAFQAANAEENGQLQEDAADANRYETLDAMMNQLMPPPSTIPPTQRSHAAIQEGAQVIVAVPSASGAEVREEAPATNNPGQLKSVNKRGRLIDPQDGAEKVAFDSQEAINNLPSLPRARGQKRKAAAAANVADEPVSEDAGFQADQRQPNAAGRRRLVRQGEGENPTPQNSSSQVSIPVAQMTENQFATQSSAESSTPDDARENGSIYEPEANNSENDNDSDANANSTQRAIAYMEAVKSEAKNAVASAGKIPQLRIGWTLPETDALISYIGQLGCSWSKIKKHDEESGGNKLSQRHQGDIKDKARNMKFDYLKASWQLPKNFDNIPLARPMIEKLHQMGIEYEQNQTRKPRNNVATVPKS